MKRILLFLGLLLGSCFAFGSGCPDYSKLSNSQLKAEAKKVHDALAPLVDAAFSEQDATALKQRGRDYKVRAEIAVIDCLRSELARRIGYQLKPMPPQDDNVRSLSTRIRVGSLEGLSSALPDR